MRPIKLTVSAFGPYAGKTVLDLDKLGENGLYPRQAQGKAQKAGP